MAPPAGWGRGGDISTYVFNNKHQGVYGDVVARYNAATEFGLREAVAAALFNKGVTLGNLKRPADAGIVLTDFVTRFAAASEPEIAELVERVRILLLNRNNK